MTNLCPCGSHEHYDNCCGQYIEGKMPAPTAEKVMRSRYTAYTLDNMEYIQLTMSGKALVTFKQTHKQDKPTPVKWHPLHVIESHIDKTDAKHAFVTFFTSYALNNRIHTIYECSEFINEGGQWYYIDGKLQTITPKDPCPCHSGKKYKKCCYLLN